MSEPVRHHWVPRSYLRAFRDDPSAPKDEAMVWIFEKDVRNFRRPDRRSVERVFLEKHLYTIETENGKDYSLEKALADEIDAKYPAILAKVETRKPLTAEEHRELCMFMAVQLVRTPRTRESIKDFASQVLRWVKKTETARGKKFHGEKDFEDWTKHAHTEHIVTSAPVIANIFQNMSLAFGCAPTTGRRFITSDAPCYVKQPIDTGFWSDGLLNPRVEIYMPISPTTVAMLSWVNCRGYFRMDNGKVEDQNRMIRGFCDKWFVSASNRASLYWFSRYPLDPIFVSKILSRRFTRWCAYLWKKYVRKG